MPGWQGRSALGDGDVSGPFDQAIHQVAGLETGRLLDLTRRFQDVRVLVIGDLMLDEYIWGEVSRMSPEAPVPVVQAERFTYGLGGAGNVVSNVVALGARAVVAGLVGEDAPGGNLLAELRAVGADTSGVVHESGRPTTVKTRVVAHSQQHSQQIVRIDRESRMKASAEVVQALWQRVCGLISEVDAVLFSDYDKGVLVPELVGPAVEAALRLKRVVGVNPKPYNLFSFQGAGLISMNQPEAQRASNREITDDASLEAAGIALRERLNCPALVITRSAHGLSLFQPNQRPQHLPPVPSEVYDGTGAGDTVISVATVALAAGATPLEAAALGNYGGALEVRKLGAASISADELRAALDGQDGA